MTHLTTLDLLAYARDPLPQSITEHLASCASCTRRYEELRDFTRTLTNPDVWRDTPGAPPQRRDDLDLLATRLVAEEHEGTNAINRCAPSDLANIPSLRTIGGVRALHRAVIAQREDHPSNALLLATAARIHAMAIKTDEYPEPLVAQTRAIAWKEEANLLRHQGEYTKALSALDAATASLKDHAALDYDAALIELVRGMTLVPMGRGAQARQVLEQSSRTLARFGDAAGQRHAELAIAFCAFEAGDYAVARSRWNKLLPSARAERDEESTARLVSNIASCDAELGHLARARRGYEEAISRFRALGLTIEITRARWGLARVGMHEASHQDAIPVLRTISEEFANAGLLGEASLVLLDVAACLLHLEEKSALANLLDDLVLRLHRHGATIAQATAISYLRDLQARNDLDLSSIATVRRFLATSHEPHQAFEATN